MTVVLDAGAVALRPLQAEDHPALLEILADPSVAAWWGLYNEARLAADAAEEDATYWTILADDLPVGLILATEEDDPDYRAVALDLFLAPSHQRRGVGGDVIRAVLRHMFEQRGHHRATIDPAVDNEYAIRCYEKLGFKRIGIGRRAERAPDGTWRDSLLMDLLAEELD